MPAPAAAPPITRAARQTRSKRTEERILRAAGELLAEKPFDQLSVGEIAARAGVSVGGFYARFASKDEVLLHLHYELYVAEMAELAAKVLAPERWTGRGIGPVAHAYFGMIIRGSRRHHALIRELVQRGRAQDRGAVKVEAYDRFVEAVHDPFRERLRERMGEITHPDPELAIRVGFSACSSALRETLLFGHMRPSMGEISDETLITELTRMFCAYLGVPFDPATDAG